MYWILITWFQMEKSKILQKRKLKTHQLYATVIILNMTTDLSRHCFTDLESCLHIITTYIFPRSTSVILNHICAHKFLLILINSNTFPRKLTHFEDFLNCKIQEIEGVRAGPRFREHGY